MHKKTIAMLLLLLLSTLLLSGCLQPEEPIPPKFQATSTTPDVDIRSINQKPGILFYIYSPTGIGDANIALTAGDLPETIQIRLFVSNLEHLELSYGDVTIIATANASGPQKETLQLAGGTANLSPGDFYWMNIQPLSAEDGAKFFGKPAYPPSFLITMPKDFFVSGQTSFSLRWVDYYR